MRPLTPALTPARVAWDGCGVRAPRRRHLAVVALGLLACACGSLSPETPTQPEPSPQAVAPAPSPTANPNPTPTPVLGGPTPKATPAPEASPQPSPSTPPAAGADGCGSPVPPPLSAINAKVHLKAGDRWTLDSTPLVTDTVFCAQIGFPDRSTCPVRPEGHPERTACELYVTGRATDTGRPGPTWSFAGSPCTGRAANGCENHPDNQYQLYAWAGGLYKACGKNGVCGEVQVDK